MKKLNLDTAAWGWHRWWSWHMIGPWLIKLMAAKMAMMMRIVMITIAASTNSHLCSFVLTQFCLTHPVAHLIFSEGGQFWKFRFIGASGVKRPGPHRTTHPFHAADTLSPSLSCFVSSTLVLNQLILSCRILCKSFIACFTTTCSACFTRKMEFPRIAFGAGNGEHQVGEMGPVLTAYLPLHTTYFIPRATTTSMVFMITMNNHMPNGYKLWKKCYVSTWIARSPFSVCMFLFLFISYWFLTAKTSKRVQYNKTKQLVEQHDTEEGATNGVGATQHAAF